MHVNMYNTGWVKTYPDHYNMYMT